MKKFFLVVDTETTMGARVADFGAVVVDKRGIVHDSLGALVREVYMDPEDELFHHADPGPFTKKNLRKRRAAYGTMLQDGRRMLASVPAINRWLAQVQARFAPTLTAYNLPFDLDKCQRTGIDLEPFQNRFCLWAASCLWLGASKRRWKAFRWHILEHHLFNAPTAYGNMSFHRKADAVASFIAPDLPPEPHTALEDARDYEGRVILPQVVNALKVSEYMGAPHPDWRQVQVRDWFVPK